MCKIESFSRALCEQYEFDPVITRLLQRCEIHLLPSLNPGIDQSEECIWHFNQSELFISDGCVHKSRSNANGKDLNRCFPDWSSLGQNIKIDHLEPEVAAVIQYLDCNDFVLSVDYHDGWSMVNIDQSEHRIIVFDQSERSIISIDQSEHFTLQFNLP